ncbi:hypothetical protein LTR10_024330 [Elasticomyces elasticus]|uniref:ATPase AAA-type core domain-containing protein n=1 Tax=Exophiala sideris TaxID=1016849 RepID=A0ABR0IUN8_9EURO|nr:hypothetical protein LTR10_024330 [Elasticomyces elasticus]KAK5021061.1 hypothetical protein LTS07_011255 [Exophiala sideris]KAK5023342.1 hypothetical protein LTR13_011207 [Exophiala sideris]KAK5048791.1 hypothetical protein LTR69_011290 [Exophiala sideris]KAK5176192.1 hypothetical protein LTR44_011242 [Eurotiomycetes sp. CCFEE 6388]
MSFALAGVFGLPIFCLSLSDSSMTKEDMKSLLNMLSPWCIVLLEDIDSAGVSRQRTQRSDKGIPISKESAKYVDQKSSEDRAPSGDLQRPSDSKISLSGLLNAIDGVAAAEGRVLIMTTNYRDQLDEALVRPGRVDMT